MAGNNERLNPLDDPEGFDFFDCPESQDEEPPIDLFADYQEEEQKPLLPHQLAFRNFVRLNRIDPAAFTSNSMFNYDLIKHEGDILSTSPSVQAGPEVLTHTVTMHDLPQASHQDPFAHIVMPPAAQQERYDRLRCISPLIVAHLDKGDISEQGLNIFMRRNFEIQYQ